MRLSDPNFKNNFKNISASFQLSYFYVKKKKKKYLPGSHANLECVGKLGAKPDPKAELCLAAITLCKTGRTLHHPQLQDLLGGGGEAEGLIPKGSCQEAVLLEIQCLQIASLNLVPCVLGGGPSVLSDESAPQSLGQRKHQWSHKPPTVQRGKTRLLQKRNFSPLRTSPAQRPSSYSREGEGEGVNPLTLGFTPLKPFLEPWHQPPWV